METQIYNSSVTSATTQSEFGTMIGVVSQLVCGGSVRRFLADVYWSGDTFGTT
jgi:hypothetical protein